VHGVAGAVDDVVERTRAEALGVEIGDRDRDRHEQEHQHGDPQRRKPAGGIAPDLPRRITLCVDIFELLPILEGVHRHPEPVMFVGHQPAL